MGVIVQHNLSAMNANRFLNITTTAKSRTTEKLSSGYRINRAADDAAGLAISEKMRGQIRGLNKAASNVQDGISFVQVADGALGEVHSMLHRMKELSVQAANGTLTDSDREAVDEETQQLIKQIDNIGSTTEFNTKKVFPKMGLFPTNGRSTGNALADRIIFDLTPNAISQILSAFPSLNAATTSSVPIGLSLDYIDGPSGTLARASLSCAFNGTDFINKIFEMEVDNEDYDVNEGYWNGGHGSVAEMLESTIAHELTHSIMQNIFTDEMVPDGPLENFPKWFKEGCAQLSGGGFTTGWNDYLEYCVSGLTSENDTTNDAQIQSYLQRSDRQSSTNVYGQGYLVCAYMGYLASGSSTVSSQAIASGMDKIFKTLINDSRPGATGGQPIGLTALTQQVTGRSLSSIIADIDNGTNAGVDFVRKLCYQSKGGAGSIVASSLSTSGTKIIGSSVTSQQKYYIDVSKLDVSWTNGGLNGDNSLIIQAGPNSSNEIRMDLYRMDSNALGLSEMDMRTQDSARDAIDSVDAAVNRVSTVRGYFGAIQNRLEHTVDSVNNTAENLSNAESRIRDTDMAKEMVCFSRDSILSQAIQSVLAQANHSSDGVLSLLQ